MLEILSLYSCRYLQSLSSGSTSGPVPGPSRMKTSTTTMRSTTCEHLPDLGQVHSKAHFFRSLKSARSNERQVGGDAKEEAKETMKHVSFSLSGLLDFQHSLREHSDLEKIESKEGDRRCRKRPNYDGTQRAFFAKGRHPSCHQLLA